MKKILMLAVMALVLGCGGDSSKKASGNDTTIISNAKYSKNAYGYYGDNVIFGNKKIQGLVYAYGINEDGTLHNFPNEMEFYDDEFFGKYDNRRTSLGVYGVSKDGKILTTHYDLFNKDVTYTYVEDMSVKNKYTNVEKKCMKVRSSFEDTVYYAFCK